MRQIVTQLEPARQCEFERFLCNGKQRISRNLEWCGFTFQDFVAAYISMQEGRQLNALIRTVLTTDCNNSNSMLSLLGMQEFTQEAMDQWLQSEMETIMHHFNQRYATMAQQQAS